MNDWIKKLEDHKHLMLLISLLVMCFIQPFAQGMLLGLALFDVFLTIVVLGIFVIIFKRGRDRRWALVLATPTIIAQWSIYVLPSEAVWAAMVIHHVFLLVFLSLAVIIVLRGIFKEPSIRSDHFIATVCGYLIVGVTWGNAYQLVDMRVPNAFSVKPEILQQFGNEHRRSFLFNYLSLSTLTGTGYGDITPIWPGVASLTWMEAMFGQFYIAIVVAQLIGLKLERSKESQAASQREAEPLN